MSGIKFYFTGDNQDVLKKINQIHTELKKVYNNKNTKIDLSAGVDFSLLGENFKRLDQQSREAFDNMSKDAQKYISNQKNYLLKQEWHAGIYHKKPGPHSTKHQDLSPFQTPYY